MEGIRLPFNWFNDSLYLVSSCDAKFLLASVFFTKDAAPFHLAALPSAEDNRRCIFFGKNWYELYWNGLIWFFTPQNIGIATKIILISCVVTEIFIKTIFLVMAALICLLEHNIFLWSVLKWLNLIMYPTKCRDRHQNYFDTLYNYQDIDENKTFSNGGLNLHIIAQNICVIYTKMA